MHLVEEYQDIITLTVDRLNECEIVTPTRRVGVKLLFNPGENRKSDSLKIRRVGERCWIEECPRETGPPGPRLSIPEQERNAVVAIGVGLNMLQFCLVSNSLSRTTLSIKWEVYFSKRLCRSSLLCRRYDSACRCICIMWLYNRNIGSHITLS